jgi:ribosomal protein L37E
MTMQARCTKCGRPAPYDRAKVVCSDCRSKKAQSCRECGSPAPNPGSGYCANCEPREAA